jgi:hypothetical protein
MIHDDDDDDVDDVDDGHYADVIGVLLVVVDNDIDNYDDNDCDIEDINNL